MKDFEDDEKIKDIEKEIDNAIDQLFVDKTSPVSLDEEGTVDASDSGMKKEEEPAIEEVREAGEGTSLLEDEAISKEEDTEKLSREIEKLKQKVERFLEWGVTDKALDNISKGIEDIRGTVDGDKFVESVSRMIHDVLEYLKNDQETYIKEMVDFLTNAFGALERLVKYVKKDEDGNAEDVFNAINEQFSTISSKMTFDIPQIELEETFAGPQVEQEEKEEETEEENVAKGKVEEKVKEDHDETEMITDEQEEEEIIELEEQVPGEQGIQGGEPEPTVEKDQELELAFVEAEKFVEKETYGESIPPKMVKEVRAEEQKTDTPSLQPLERKFSDIVEELRLVYREVEKSFFSANALYDLAGKLSNEMDELSMMVNRFVAISSAGVPSEKELNSLQNTVNKLHGDFDTLSKIVGTKEEESLTVEEVVPVIIGKRMVGLPASMIKNVFAITERQEAIFKEKGFVTFKNEKVLLIDLLGEYGEVSRNREKRLVLVEDTAGNKKVLLVDRVLKRRFALVSQEKATDLPRKAKFYFAEEIPIYESF